MTELIYFDGRGFAEIIRILLNYCGVKYTEKDLTTRSEYLTIESELIFGQVPLLRIDGMNLVQSRAIVHYLANKYHLYGSNDVERAKIDMMFEGSRDFYAAFLPMVIFKPEVEVKNDIKEKTFPKFLPAFNKVLSENSSGYLVGSSSSLADLALLECLLATVDYFGEEPFTEYPHIQIFYKKMLQDGKIKKYREQIRKPKSTEEFVAMAKSVLSHVFA